MAATPPRTPVATRARATPATPATSVSTSAATPVMQVTAAMAAASTTPPPPVPRPHQKQQRPPQLTASAGEPRTATTAASPRAGSSPLPGSADADLEFANRHFGKLALEDKRTELEQAHRELEAAKARIADLEADLIAAEERVGELEEENKFVGALAEQLEERDNFLKLENTVLKATGDPKKPMKASSVLEAIFGEEKSKVLEKLQNHFGPKCYIATDFVNSLLVKNREPLLSFGSGNLTFELAILNMRGESEGESNIASVYKVLSPEKYMLLGLTEYKYDGGGETSRNYDADYGDDDRGGDGGNVEEDDAGEATASAWALASSVNLPSTAATVATIGRGGNAGSGDALPVGTFGAPMSLNSGAMIRAAESEVGLGDQGSGTEDAASFDADMITVNETIEKIGMGSYQTYQAHLTLLSLFWPVGQLVASIFAWIFLTGTGSDGGVANDDGWRRVLVSLCVTTLGMLVGRRLLFDMLESPKFLVAAGRGEEAGRVLQELARRNGRGEAAAAAAVPALAVRDARAAYRSLPASASAAAVPTATTTGIEYDGGDDDEDDEDTARPDAGGSASSARLPAPLPGASGDPSASIVSDATWAHGDSSTTVGAGGRRMGGGRVLSELVAEHIRRLQADARAGVSVLKSHLLVLVAPELL
ncbi:hypothetical protein HK405_007523, partial [Cladochytrium tenue]